MIIGDAITQADVKYKQELLKYIADNSLNNDIYIPGFRNDIADILAATDCVIVPSFEGLGLVAMEAMSARTCVVAMEKGGSFELLNAAECGITYAENSSQSQIADAVNKSIAQSDERVERGFMFCKKQSYKNYSSGLHEIFKQ